MYIFLGRTLVVTSVFVFLSFSSFSQNLVHSDFASGFDRPSGFVADPFGNFFVWEQGGVVWFVSKDGVKSPTPVLDINPEVYSRSQLGFMTVLLDPNYAENGLIYTYYMVDLYWDLLTNKNTFDPLQGDGAFRGHPTVSFVRVTRYKLNNVATSPTLDNSSRFVLISPTRVGAPVVTSFSHGGGGMAFGHDGSLLIAIGDGAGDNSDQIGDAGSSSPWTDWEGGLIYNIIRNDENTGTLRVLDKNSYSGKVLRIDAVTGQGLPSNPHFNASSPSSALSRFWAYGFRNPFKMDYIDDLSGSHHHSKGNPGKFLVGDVGSYIAEELNLLSGRSQFFGWPKYEGISFSNTWGGLLTWPIPASDTLILPFLSYRNSAVSSLNKDSVVFNVPIIGADTIKGSSNSGGFLYTKNDFPKEYHNTIFTADFTGRSIYNIKLDSVFNAKEINVFGSDLGTISAVGINSKLDGIFYISLSRGTISRIQYQDTTTVKLVAKIMASHESGYSPNLVNFNAEGSIYTGSGTLSYLWDFGDGKTSVSKNVAHQFSDSDAKVMKVKLTVYDNFGKMSYDSTYFHLNSVPSKINSTSVTSINSISAEADTTLSLSFTSDFAIPDSLVTWRIIEGHDGHEHLRLTKFGNNQTAVLPSVYCNPGRATYWYRVDLDIRNAFGLIETTSHNIYVNCLTGSNQSISFSNIADKNFGILELDLLATASSGLNVEYFLIDGEKAKIDGNKLKFEPNAIGLYRVRAVQSGSAVFKPAMPIDQTFRVIKNVCEEFFSITDLVDGKRFESYNNATISDSVIFVDPSHKRVKLSLNSTTLLPGVEITADEGHYEISSKVCP